MEVDMLMADASDELDAKMQGVERAKTENGAALDIPVLKFHQLSVTDGFKEPNER